MQGLAPQGERDFAKWSVRGDAAIQAITEDGRLCRLREVNTDLVCAARLQATTHEGSTLEGIEPFDVGAGPLPRAPRCDLRGELESLGRVTSMERLETRAPGISKRESEIAALDVMFLEQGFESLAGGGVLADDEQAAGVFVDAMDDAWSEVAFTVTGISVVG